MDLPDNVHRLVQPGEVPPEHLEGEVQPLPDGAVEKAYERLFGTEK